MVARKLASLVMKHNFCMYSQHFAGWLNVVADSLSRDFHLKDDFLTHLLFFFYPNQLPPTFKISPLPTEIISFIIGVLEASPCLQPVQSQRQASTIGDGLVGVPLPPTCGLEQTHSWIQSHLNSELFSSAPSPAQFAQQSLADHLTVG